MKSGFGLDNFMFIVPMIAVIYFLIFLPKKKEQQAFNKMMSELKKGDKVLTNSGMYGEVAAIKDDIVTLRFGDTKIDFSKSSIQKTVDEKSAVEAKA